VRRDKSFGASALMPAALALSAATAPQWRAVTTRGLNLSHLLVVGGSPAERLCVARAVHGESVLRLGPFVAVDCATEEPKLREALSDWLGFAGRTNSAHPLWSAERGTLFLDAIGRLSADTQQQLLAFAARDLLNSSGREARGAGRLAAGCDEDPWDLVAQGRFLAQLADVLDKIRVDLDPRRQQGTA
jgi:DNA-binding NtrC family response regulator